MGFVCKGCTVHDSMQINISEKKGYSDGNIHKKGGSICMLCNVHAGMRIEGNSGKYT